MKNGTWDRVTRAGAALSIAIALLAIAPAGGVAQTASGTYESTENQYTLLARVDVGCIFRNWMIVGAMVCTRGFDVNFCLIYQNPYPVGAVESVRRAGSSHLQEGTAYLKALTAVPWFGKTSSHSTDQGSGTGLQFSEAHAYSWVPDFRIGDYMIAKPNSTTTLTTAYLSEIDGFFWRTPGAEFLENPTGALTKTVSCAQVPRPTDCAGFWGPWHPQTGFHVQPSEVKAGAVAALRAGRIGAKPGTRITIGSYPYEPRTGHFLQMVRPTWKPCTSIGQMSPWGVNPLDAGGTSPEGAYLFIHYGIFIECEGCFPAILLGPRFPI
jgi:hypothetical protein